MPKDVTLAVRDLRSLVEDGEITDKAKAKLAAALKEVDDARGATQIVNVRADSAADQLSVVTSMLNKHLRRYPNTECALALSLAGFLRGETNGEYLR